MSISVRFSWCFWITFGKVWSCWSHLVGAFVMANLSCNCWTLPRTPRLKPSYTHLLSIPLYSTAPLKQDRKVLNRFEKQHRTELANIYNYSIYTWTIQCYIYIYACPSSWRLLTCQWQILYVIIPCRLHIWYPIKDGSLFRTRNPRLPPHSHWKSWMAAMIGRASRCAGEVRIPSHLQRSTSLVRHSETGGPSLSRLSTQQIDSQFTNSAVLGGWTDT